MADDKKPEGASEKKPKPIEQRYKGRHKEVICLKCGGETAPVYAAHYHEVGKLKWLPITGLRYCVSCHSIKKLKIATVMVAKEVMRA